MFKIRFKSRVLKSAKKLSKKEKGRVKEVINTIEFDPLPFRKYDIQKLSGHQDTYRIRIGRVRITYEVDPKERLIIVHYIGYRSGAY